LSHAWREHGLERSPVTAHNPTQYYVIVQNMDGSVNSYIGFEGLCGNQNG